MTPTGFSTLAFLAMAAPIAAHGLAAEPASLLRPVSNVWLENDLVVRTDQHYTHGSRIGHAFAEHPADAPDAPLARLAGWLPNIGSRPVAWRPAVSVTQNIYTPGDTSRPDLITDDRPYAGWLFATASILKRGTVGSHAPVLDAWSAKVGVVGPASMAEQSQNTVHRVRALPLAQGWDNQLRNEPDVGFRYARVLRYAAPVRGQVTGEFLPHMGLVAGTAQSFVSLGAQWRIGLRIPNDFGWRSIDDVIPASGGRPEGEEPRRGFHGFLAADARAFGHNVLVQGNLFHESHSMPLQRVVGEVKAGLVYSGRRWDVAYTHQVRTAEFKGQGDVDSFGSFSVGIKW